jgi:glycosyltransferase involved in cell wall biosynthesis
MKLSIIVVCYEMSREIPRTLISLQRNYQQGIENLDYEVIVVENGSPHSLPEGTLDSLGPEFRYVYLDAPPPSPAYALNHGAELATGDVICLMVDGATLLSPGVLEKVSRCFTAYEDPVVALRYFFLGPGEQNDTISQGYNQQEEDRLLASINWPEDGYRLFEISTPIRFPEQQKSSWTDKIIESNCLCMRKQTFQELGGCDERFDMPGGGFMNIDLFQRAASKPETTLILLIGEGVFHQVHGGTTTNVTPQDRDAEVQTYEDQYREIHGCDLVQTKTDFYYFGHLPNEASKIQRRNFSE